jgi:hypothetical protein
MPAFVERILDHPHLTIDLLKTKDGILYYEGTSEKYEPRTAVSDSAWKCFLKFDIPLWEQKLIAEQIRKHDS